MGEVVGWAEDLGTWLLKSQSKMLGDAYLLQCFPGSVMLPRVCAGG